MFSQFSPEQRRFLDFRVSENGYRVSENSNCDYGPVILSQSNQLIIKPPSEMTSMEMLFRQQLEFQKQQA